MAAIRGAPRRRHVFTLIDAIEVRIASCLLDTCTHICTDVPIPTALKYTKALRFRERCAAGTAPNTATFTVQETWVIPSALIFVACHAGAPIVLHWISIAVISTCCCEVAHALVLPALVLPRNV